MSVLLFLELVHELKTEPQLFIFLFMTKLPLNYFQKRKKMFTIILMLNSFSFHNLV